VANLITVAQMAKTGLYLNLTAAIIITFMTYYLGLYIFDIRLGEFPVWATPK
jgi:hypothetical protein